MPASDFALYVAYYRKQPFGLWRQDYNAARIAQAMAGGKLEELMPFWFEQNPDEATSEALEELLVGAIAV